LKGSAILLRMEKALKTATGTEIFAGITTFMTMSYIIFANPHILAAAGVPLAAAQSATCLGAGLACILMAVVARYPFALAPGMGLNAFLAFTVVKGMGLPWQTGMAVIFVEGLIITLLVIMGLRNWIMTALPLSLKHAIGLAIGLFIAFIGLKQGGIIVPDPDTSVAMGDLGKPDAIVAIAGLVVTFALLAWRVPGALLIGIAVATVLADWQFGLARLPASAGAVFAPPDFSTVGAFMPHLKDVFTPALVPVLFAFLLTDFFDTMGTVIAVGSQAGFVDRKGGMPRLGNVLIVDSLAAALGGAVGSSSITTYIESASGVAAGGRRGTTAMAVGILFLVALFLTPLAAAVPACAVAPALVAVGFMMMGSVAKVKWTSLEEGVPAFLTLLITPLSFSISAGVGWGVLAYVLIRVLRGKLREVHPVLWVTAAVFALAFSPLVPK